MKYAIVIPDGCADMPMEQLAGKTPLEAARTPHMDRVAATGMVGLSNNTPAHLPAGSEVANLCLLGYDPDQYFTGRAPLEAAAQGIELGPDDWAVRCNLVTIEDQVMVDFTADHVSTAEATELLQAVQATLGSEQLQFVPGVSYRNLLLYRGSETRRAPFTTETRTRAPHDLTDLPVTEDYPRGPGSDLLNDLMTRSVDIFRDHPVNQRRREAGKRPVTNLWLWGLGGAPALPSFASKYGVQGVMITAVDLLRGIAALAGWPRIEVVGATGYLDTDYAAKGRAAIEALREYDLVCVHIEAPDEASHEGRHDAKIEALEQIDSCIVGPLLDALAAEGEYRLLVTPDHPTPCATKKHSHGDVPLAMCGRGIEPDGAQTYCEREAEQSELRLPRGWDLMDRFIQG
ncbi:cofactor-independent phosphoglycerate mutase [Planctomycetaceae bacterium SH139]